MARKPRISVIIPTLDEQARIVPCLEQFAGLERIVVDGGSRDRTVELARATGAKVLSSPAGRALQQNRGALEATGDVLWFVHADVGVPPEAPNAIQLALTDPSVVGGAFRTRTVAERATRLTAVLPVADLRASYTHHPYGDQAIFVRRTAFEAVGGFPLQPLFEDLELCRRLWKIGRLEVSPVTVQVSARRFLARPAWYTAVMNLYPILYRLGVSPDLLARGYGRPR